jgi:hypothetical protein
MKKAARRRGRKDLQKAFDDMVDRLPHKFASDLFKKKLTEAGLEPSPKLVAKLVDHTLAGGEGEFKWPGGQDIQLVITDQDLADLDRAMKAFLDEMPNLVGEIGIAAARKMLRSLKQAWPERYRWETEQNDGFRSRLGERWAEPLNLLRMMLTISREVGEAAAKQNRKSRAKRNRRKRHVLSQLHVRACQVTAEIIALLEAGFADGAMARWRTLYEIGVVAALIAEHDDGLAERYLAHEVIESRKALEVFVTTHEELGYAPPSPEEIAEVERLCQVAVAQFGPEFERNYGWAAKHLAHKNPTFVELQKAAGRARMRSHYKMASYNVHADIKGITFKLGSVSNPRQVIAGASNAGLEEPGQNTAISLAQITMPLLVDRPQLDDVVTMRVLATLQGETVDAFIKVSRQLKREERDRQRGKRN